MGPLEPVEFLLQCQSTTKFHTGEELLGGLKLRVLLEALIVDQGQFSRSCLEYADLKGSIRG